MSLVKSMETRLQVHPEHHQLTTGHTCISYQTLKLDVSSLKDVLVYNNDLILTANDPCRQLFAHVMQPYEYNTYISLQTDGGIVKKLLWIN